MKSLTDLYQVKVDEVYSRIKCRYPDLNWDIDWGLKLPPFRHASGWGLKGYCKGYGQGVSLGTEFPTFKDWIKGARRIYLTIKFAKERKKK